MTTETGPIRIYVAASSKEMPRVDRALALIDALGPARAVVTYRWIDDMRATIASGRSEGDLTPAESRAAALKCLEGVWSAHVTWLLYPRTSTCGAWAELGAVVTARVAPVYVSVPAPLFVVSYETPEDMERPTVPKIWRHLADHAFPTDDAVGPWLASLR